jgi:hypothetical protein
MADRGVSEHVARMMMVFGRSVRVCRGCSLWEMGAAYSAHQVPPATRRSPLRNRMRCGRLCCKHAVGTGRVCFLHLHRL